jgi:hypothetical protein
MSNELIRNALVRETSNNSYESKETLSRVIDDAGLRNLCGPSGTTTDIIAGLHAMPPPTPLDLERTLALLLQCAGNKSLKEITPSAKQMLTTITFYMQPGQYHTAGEVLTGILASAIGIFKSKKKGPDEPQFINEAIEIATGITNEVEFTNLLRGLLEEFAATPKNFFYSIAHTPAEKFANAAESILQVRRKI